MLAMSKTIEHEQVLWVYYHRFCLALVLAAAAFLPTSIALSHGLGVGALLYLLPHYKQCKGCFQYWRGSNWLMLAFVLWVILSMAWGVADGGSMLRESWKYLSKVLYLWLLVVFFLQSGLAKQTLWCFQLGVYACVGLAIVYALFAEGGLSAFHAAAPIPLSVLVAFVAFMQLHAMTDGKAKYGAMLGWVIMFGFEFFVNIERTGMLIFCALTLLYVYQRWGGRILIMCGMALPFLLMVLIFASPQLKQRVWQAGHDIQQMQQHKDLSRNSLGLRMTFAKFSLHSIGQAPILGRGIASFTYDYGRSGWVTIDNQGFVNDPENSYLHVAYELGVIGLLLLCGWLMMQGFEARLLPAYSRHRLQGVLATFVLASGCVSALHDHRLSMFYVTLFALFFAHGLQRDYKQADQPVRP